MKKTQVIDLLTTIRGSLVPFVAITMFVALGAGMFLGVHWVAGAMHAMAGEQFAQGNMHDVEITFPYGLTEDDLNELQNLDKDDLTIEATRVAYEKLASKKTNVVYSVRVGTLPSSIDTFVTVEGALPQATNEIALEAFTAKKFGLAVGDTVHFSGSEGGIKYLKDTDYTVSALVTSPAYLSSSPATYGMSLSGTVDAMGWVVPEAFDEMAYLGAYPYVVLRSKRLAALDQFGEEYRQGVEELEERVHTLGETLGSKRMDELHKLADLVNSSSAATQIAADYRELKARRDAGQLDDATYETELGTLGTRAKKLMEEQKIDTSGLSDEDAASVAVALGGVFAETEDEMIGALKNQLASLVDYAWIVLPRTYNGSVVLMDSYTGVTSNLRWTMASLFLIVGILVCYSSVSRIVHEHTARIGVKKALGFRASEVYGLFLAYSLLCVVLGMIMGVVGGRFVVEGILIRVLGSRFVPHIALYSSWKDALLMAALEFVLIMGATWVAVAGVLRRQAVDLLAGNRPQKVGERFFESWAIWKRMGMLAQVTVNNCINDKRRMVGTIIGVAGCTALIACAVTLHNNVTRSFDKQYADVTHYDAVTNVAAGSEAAATGAQILETAGMRATPVFQRTLTLRQPDGTISAATVTVPIDTSSFTELMTVKPLDAGDTDTASGAWVSEAYKEHMGAKVGDKITLVDVSGNICELPIAGFFEWHMLSHQIVVSRELYETSFGVKVETNRLLVDTCGKGAEAVKETLGKTAGYVGTRDDKATNRSGFNELSRIARVVVLVYLALAVVMAACVLLNLDFMFVDEKKRELITLMICGFSLKQAKGYIWHDSVVLTVIGIVGGLVLGGVVGDATVSSIELANASFVHGISWLAMGVAVLATTVLAAAALLAALRRINRFELIDINRF